VKLDTKKAIGIDISGTHISLALLKKSSDGVKLLKAVSCPVPAGAVKDGKIENTAILAKAVRKLRNRIGMQTTRTAVSLFAEPTAMQIMDLPSQVPSNIGKFVRDQVKHFAVLLGKRIALDFFAVSGIGSGAGLASRVLTVATDGQQVDKLVEMYRRAGITVEAIEPPLLACTRALYAEKIEKNYDSNVLIAVLRDNSLTLCVFRKQTMDFVRTRQISEEKTEPGELCQWLAGQMNTIIQSYDIETPLSCRKWEVAVVADCARLPADAQEILKANVARANLQLLTSKDICQTAVVSPSRRFTNCRQTGEPSLPAIGLAMKLLDTGVCNLGVNLLPQEAIKLRATQKRALITANIMATVLLLMILLVSGPVWKTKKLNESIEDKRARLSQSARSLVEKRELVNGQVNTISSKLSLINKILDSRRDAYWPGLLSDVAKKRPKTVCITSLSSNTGSQMSLKGLAISNEDVYLFVDMLNKSEHIDSAAIFETKKDSDNNGLVSFEIRCSLVARKGV
jgi:Tfp pilus assembly protein PilN